MSGSILDAIGLPLVCVDPPEGSTVAVRTEPKSPGGPVEDRLALAMVEMAEEAGDISPGDYLVEPTSGNTGIGPAVTATAKDYDLTIVTSDPVSLKRHKIIHAYGAVIGLADDDISAAKDHADDFKTEGMYQFRQFENPTNPEMCYRTITEGVLEQMGDRCTNTLVAGVGTGDTISGIGNCPVEELSSVRAVGVELAKNAALSGREVGNSDFQGMGPGFVSPNFGIDLLDDMEVVELADAEAECYRPVHEEGIPVGQPSGASPFAVKRVAERLATPDADEEDQLLVVTVFWDSGKRYMSTGIFNTKE